MKTIIEMPEPDGMDKDDTCYYTADQMREYAELVLAAERNHIAGVFEDNHEVVKHRNNYWLHAANYVRARGKEALAQPEERNFCPRCGKRTADLATIHTCTPPIAADPEAFYGFPSGSVSAPNAGGKCVTDGETSPVKEIDPNAWAFDRGLEST